jgi:predicted acyltransferase (DUF342 family)
MREERGRLSGEVIVYEPFNLWGSVGGRVRVIQGGKLYVRGAIYGDLVVEYGGRCHVFGNISGNLVVERGAKVIHSGVLGGDATNTGGRLLIESMSKVGGKVKTVDGETTDQRRPPKAPAAPK